MTDLIGHVLGGRYQVLELIGEGGMAEVYKARHTQLDRLVAIKVLHRFLAKDKGFRARFEREAQLNARMRHPHIVEVFDYGASEADKLYYIVVEYIDGPSLSAYLNNLAENNKRLSLNELLRISRDVASALSYAHAHAMIHRDVKPSNVLLEHGHRVVLTDFGIAKMITSTPSNGQLTTSDTMLGTPAYMAPEQALGEPGDAGSDIYSLGVMMYQMATGHYPFTADSPVALAVKHVNEIPSPPRDIDPDIPLELNNIIMRCLMKDPADRYLRADELFDDLSAVAVSTRHDNSAVTQSYRRSLDIKRTTSTNTSRLKYSVDRTAPTLVETGSRRRGVLLGISMLVPLIALGAFLTSGSNFLPSILNTTQNPTQDSVPTIAPTIAPTNSPLPPSATSKPDNTATPVPCIAAGSVRNGASIRTGPGLNYFIIAKLGINSLVTVLGYADNTYGQLRWWAVDYKGKVGWVIDSEVLLNGDCKAVSPFALPPTQIPGRPIYTLIPAGTATPATGNQPGGNPGNSGSNPSNPSPRTPTRIPPTSVQSSPTNVPPTNLPPTDPPPPPPTDIPPTQVPPTDPPPPPPTDPPPPPPPTDPPPPPEGPFDG